MTTPLENLHDDSLSLQPRAALAGCAGEGAEEAGPTEQLSPTEDSSTAQNSAPVEDGEPREVPAPPAGIAFSLSEHYLGGNSYWPV